MKFDKYFPTAQLKPYIKFFVVAESDWESEYKVYPSTGLVIGFQYKGRLAIINNNKEHKLASSGITGISDSFRVFKNSDNIGTILVYFTEIGFAQFSSNPVHELFNQSLSLDLVFDKAGVTELEDRLAEVQTDEERVGRVQQFFLIRLKHNETDKLIAEAVKLIFQSNGTIRVRELQNKLFVSQSPFEKRFRKLVGSSPKKFANIVRFQSILNSLNGPKPMADICYENNYFDQAHFINDFKQFTGETPQNFKRSL